MYTSPPASERTGAPPSLAALEGIQRALTSADAESLPSPGLSAPRLSEALSRALLRSAARVRWKRPPADADESEEEDCDYGEDEDGDEHELGGAAGHRAPRSGASAAPLFSAPGLEDSSAAPVRPYPGLPAGSVLVIATTPTPPSQAVPVLNAAFAARKLGFIVDAALLFGRGDGAAGPKAECAPVGADGKVEGLKGSGTAKGAAGTGIPPGGQAARSDALGSDPLRQACLLAGGLCLSPPRPKALLQHLLSSVAASPPTRLALRPPALEAVGFRPPDVETGTPVDAGFVCASCLAVHARPVASCAVCGSEGVRAPRA